MSGGCSIHSPLCLFIPRLAYSSSSDSSSDSEDEAADKDAANKSGDDEAAIFGSDSD
mgnify:CR=1 FL=1